MQRAVPTNVSLVVGTVRFILIRQFLNKCNLLE